LAFTQGRVKNETETHVQMELEAISGRVVTVDKKYLPSAFGGSAGMRVLLLVVVVVMAVVVVTVVELRMK
jgi:hypothetical protein